LEHIILVTGDGDFVALVDWLSKRGKRITVIGLGRGYTSVELIRASDEYYNIDEMEGVITD
ncbi:MAG: NYN domain-containing protein, partial [candidate division WOR-3 bacterium]|nr:NYN domain-containing protein [candidate division WOR-3 bacterium]